MMKKIILIGIVLPLGLCGCTDTRINLAQRNWNGRFSSASVTISNLERYNAPPLLTSQLGALLGEPDYQVFPKEFASSLKKEHREDVMQCLWWEYRYWKLGRSHAYMTTLTGSWRSDGEFKKVLCWVYEERKHFSEPLPSCIGPEPMFRTYVFFIEGKNVVGLDTLFDLKKSGYSGYKYLAKEKSNRKAINSPGNELRTHDGRGNKK
jgi:hypothetical protein